MAAEVKVEPGQVWADNDWRALGRTIRIETVSDTHAVATVLTDAPASIRSNVGRKTRPIRLDRFAPTPTGYQLVTA